MSKFTNQFVQEVTDKLDSLNDIGGADSLAEYIEIMEKLQAIMQARLENAKMQSEMEAS